MPLLKLQEQLMLDGHTQSQIQAKALNYSFSTICLSTKFFGTIVPTQDFKSL